MSSTADLPSLVQLGPAPASSRRSIGWAYTPVLVAHPVPVLWYVRYRWTIGCGLLLLVIASLAAILGWELGRPDDAPVHFVAPSEAPKSRWEVDGVGSLVETQRCDHNYLVSRDGDLTSQLNFSVLRTMGGRRHYALVLDGNVVAFGRDGANGTISVAVVDGFDIEDADRLLAAHVQAMDPAPVDGPWIHATSGATYNVTRTSVDAFEADSYPEEGDGRPVVHLSRRHATVDGVESIWSDATITILPRAHYTY